MKIKVNIKKNPYLIDVLLSHGSEVASPGVEVCFTVHFVFFITDYS